MSRRGASIALLVGVAHLAWVSLPGVASAQSTAREIARPPSSYLQAPTEDIALDRRAPSELDAPESLWPQPTTSLANDMAYPVGGTESDAGIVWNGLGFFIGAYVSGLLFTTPFMATRSGDEGFGVFGFVPFAQWAVGFYDTTPWGPRTTIFISGAVWTFWEIIGGIILLAGLTHHRDLLRPGAAAGDVSFSRDGVQVAF